MMNCRTDTGATGLENGFLYQSDYVYADGGEDNDMVFYATVEGIEFELYEDGGHRVRVQIPWRDFDPMQAHAREDLGEKPPLGYRSMPFSSGDLQRIEYREGSPQTGRWIFAENPYGKFQAIVNREGIRGYFYHAAMWRPKKRREVSIPWSEMDRVQLHVRRDI